MILVDANLLLYAKFGDLPQHPRAVQWLQQIVRDGVRVGLPWTSLLAFVRVGSNPRVFARPLALRDAWRQVEEWLALPTVWIPGPTEQHAQVLGRLLVDANVGGNIVMDAHLAALSLEHGLELCTADSDYARFPGVRWRNPLVADVREAKGHYQARRPRRAARAAAR